MKEPMKVDRRRRTVRQTLNDSGLNQQGAQNVSSSLITPNNEEETKSVSDAASSITNQVGFISDIQTDPFKQARTFQSTLDKQSNMIKSNSISELEIGPLHYSSELSERIQPESEEKKEWMKLIGCSSEDIDEVVESLSLALNDPKSTSKLLEYSGSIFNEFLMPSLAELTSRFKLIEDSPIQFAELLLQFLQAQAEDSPVALSVSKDEKPSQLISRMLA